ncbi:transposase [Aliifodinibius sp. S!AR15-10]|uniref:transposase n=1 Tax=Aliifodinibius sp. S!AR15-10 TaxID=2950437 RepID=UPI00285942F1|nr:transposase [Aliifodinibius sp. S!AR15-10]MDR8391600.1 transposase [Aliifodinibius sp. S!AR15-10]
MEFLPNNWYHIYNRGNNRANIFFENENYIFFLEKIRKHWLSHCEIAAYCLMPNHFHFLVKIKESYTQGQLNKRIAITLRSYTQAINRSFDRTGSLFEESTKAKCLSKGKSVKNYNYPLICLHYIHQNPLRAKLVNQLREWRFSSFPDLAEFRNGSLPAKDLVYQYFQFNNKGDFRQQSLTAVPTQITKQLF